MANISGAYDPNAEPGGDLDPIPAGKYKAEITESDVEPISKQNNKGQCLKLVWKVCDGEQFAGRLIWQRLNLWPENMNNQDKVVSIANGQFASIRKACGVEMPNDSTELHHRPCMVSVKIKKQEGYNDQNEVSSVAPLNGGSGQSAPPAANGQAPAQSGSRPWGKPAAAAG